MPRKSTCPNPPRSAFPLEEIRFAAVNHLCVNLGYEGTTRLVEPYSLRRTQAGNLVLHTLRHDSKEHRSYRIDGIQSASATTTPFTPTYAVEFSSAGRLAAPPQTSTRRPTSARSSHRPTSGPTYVVECPVCQKRFSRKTSRTRLNPHNDKWGYPCSGRAGYLVDTHW